MSPQAPAAPAVKNYQRRTIIIDKPFQYKFIAVVMACVAAALAVIAVDMFTSLGRYVAADPSSDPSMVYRDSWMAFAVKAVVFMTGVFVVSLVVSHRIAGPMYRFEKSCEEVALGNLAHRTTTRNGDEWTGFRESFNGMVEALQVKAKEDHAHAQAARQMAEELAADGALPQAARDKARKVSTEAGLVGARFKLT